MSLEVKSLQSRSVVTVSEVKEKFWAVAFKKIQTLLPGLVAHGVPGQPRLHRETLSQKPKKRKKERKKDRFCVCLFCYCLLVFETGSFVVQAVLEPTVYPVMTSNF